MNLFAGVTGKNINQNFEWSNEPADWCFTDKGLEVFAPPSSDYFIDEEGPSTRLSAPFLYTQVTGDFSLTTRVEVDMRSMFDSGCIMIMSDLDNWAKLCYENWINEPSIVSVVTKVFSDDCPSLRIGNVKPYFRVLRSGNCFGFHYSIDGEKWTVIRYFNMNIPKEIKVGVVAQSPVGNGCPVIFEFLDLKQETIKSAKFC